MKSIRFVAWLSLSMVLSACAVVTTAGDIARRKDKQYWRETINSPSTIFGLATK